MTDAPTDIARLFALDPRDLTDRDLNAIIADLRTRRHQFNAGSLKAGSLKPAKSDLKLSLAASLVEVKL